jgi:Nitrile hydratase, alpha chain
VSEATGSSGGSRAEMERRLIQRSLQDDAFRQRLLEDPKGTIEQEFGRPVPAEVQIRVVEETPETLYLVLPSTSPVGGGGEISDRDLESVAGGQSGQEENSMRYSCPEYQPCI